MFSKALMLHEHTEKLIPGELKNAKFMQWQKEMLYCLWICVEQKKKDTKYYEICCSIC